MSNGPRRQPASLRAGVAQRAQEAARAAERERTRTQRRTAWIAGSVAVVVVVAAIVGFVVTRPTETAPPVSQDAMDLGCVSCHSTDGARSEGPTWKGLYGSTVMLADGSTTTVDEAYLRRAITDPQADVAPGYPTAMPTLDVSPAQLDRLVAYIRSLGD